MSNNNNEKKNIESFIKNKKYFGFALDPIHIGTGGYSLGGVDNTIVREPTTKIPKIPGTSITGVIREYAKIHIMETDEECKSISDDNNEKSPEQIIRKHFGDEEKQSFLRFYDGQIIFFPISSILGTVWITTKQLLKYWDIIAIDLSLSEDKVYPLKGITDEQQLNLGWMLLEIEKRKDDKEPILSLPKEIDQILSKIVIVSEKIFSHLVNDNLEVRTSVKIDSKTGTAEKGHLFTYEAIPRGTIIGFEITVDTYRGENIQEELIDLVKSSFKYMKLLGIGGRSTRGFGRIEIFDATSSSGGDLE